MRTRNHTVTGEKRQAQDPLHFMVKILFPRFDSVCYLKFR